MNERSDLDRVFVRWFEDGPSAMPDRVVDVVADRISHQRQRHAWRLPGRLPMNTYAKVIAGLAAGLVVAVVGWNLLPKNNDGMGGQPTPTATTAPSRAAAPSTGPSSPQPTAAWWGSPTECGFPTVCAGALSPGSHASGSFRPSLTYTVPAGWVNTADWHDREDYFALLPDTPANRDAASRDLVADSIVIVPHAQVTNETCLFPQEGVGMSASEIVTALTARNGLDITEPVDVTISGLAGRQVDVGLEPGWTGSCPADAEAGAAVPLLNTRVAQGENRRRIIILDTPSCGDTVIQTACAARGNIVIEIYSDQAADFEAFLASAMPIVESFEFDIAE
jgi:hypothetical protein